MVCGNFISSGERERDGNVEEVEYEECGALDGDLLPNITSGSKWLNMMEENMYVIG